MTQQEFMERTGITPTAEDFDYIHAVYLNTSMNAVGLVGEMEVVKRTIELGLPLWDEDRMVVLSMIEEQGK